MSSCLTLVPRQIAYLASARRTRNRLERPPRGEGSRDLQVNQFVRRFAEEPLAVYRDLVGRRGDDGADFSFGELSETFGNIGRHIDSLCASELVAVRPDYAEALATLKNECEELITAGNPYAESLTFVAKWVEVFDFIVFRTQTQPEIESLGLDVSDSYGLLCARLRQRRRLLLLGGSRVGFQPYDAAVTIRDVLEGNDVNEITGKRWRPMWTKSRERVRTLVALPDVILLPTYNELDAAFFTKVRQVPMFVLGLIEAPSLNADGETLSPFRFFDHDAFHAEDLRRTLNGAGVGHPIGSQDQRMEFWDDNTRALRQWIEAQPDEFDQRAADIVLFSALHEPISGVAGTAVVEGSFIAARLQNPEFTRRLNLRYTDGEFEQPDARVRRRLEEMTARLLARVNELPEPQAAAQDHAA